MFGWQDNYAAMGVSRSHVKRVVAYVQSQRDRHAAGTVWAEAEPNWDIGDADAEPGSSNKAEEQH